MTRLILFTLVAMYTAGSTTFAAIPQYKKPEILARANGPDSYNLPPMSFLNSTSPFINNNGDVAFKLMAVEGKTNQALWVNGKIVYRAPEGKVLTDPAMNSLGQVVVTVFEEGTSEGIFIYDIKKTTFQNVVPSNNKDIIAHSYPQILNSSEIFFRAAHPGDYHSLFSFNQSLMTKIFSEGEDTGSFKASYIFGPVVNNQRQIATKIRLGNRKDWGDQFPDQIVLTDMSGNSRVVAEDQKINSQSPYKSFNNSVALSEKGHVTFVAVNNNDKRSIVLDFKGHPTRIASEGENGISEIEMFSPQVNSHGLVLFRAKDSEGKRGIYLADGNELRRIVGEGDELPSDIGPAKIPSYTNFPAFGGNVRINDKNEVVFYVILASAAGGQDWGSAIYKLSPLF